MGGDQTHSVVRSAAGVPADRRLAGDFGVQADRFGNVAGFVFRLMIPLVDPFQPMRGDYPTGFLHGSDLIG